MGGTVSPARPDKEVARAAAIEAMLLHRAAAIEAMLLRKAAAIEAMLLRRATPASRRMTIAAGNRGR
jgi:hypothetical protein